MKWSLVYTFFRSLTLDHLERSLYSISRQTLKPDEYIFFDNNTDYSEEDIKKVISKHCNLSDWKLHFEKHHDPKKTASWCQNTAIRLSENDVFVLGKADCIYDFTFCYRLLTLFAMKSHYNNNPMNFTTCYLFQMPYLSKAPHDTVDHASDLEPLNWRENPQNLLKNSVGAQLMNAVINDAASYCTTKHAMEAADWYDEELIGWGYWQLALQGAMHSKGINFHIIPEVLYFHMMHSIEGPERNLQRAHAEWLQSSRRRR